MLDKIRKMLGAKERENYVEKTPEDIYRGISERTDIPKEDIAKIGGVESQHGKYTKNMGGGSASGVMQVMPRLFKTMNPDSKEVLDDSNTQESIASDIINMNTPTIKELSKTGGVLNDYVMYNLGKGTGKKFLKAKDEDSIASVLPAHIIKANPKLYKYKTVGEARKAMGQMLDSRGAEQEFYPDTKDFASLFNKEE
jgi:hypothetical protein